MIWWALAIVVVLGGVTWFWLKTPEGTEVADDLRDAASEIRDKVRGQKPGRKS